MARSPSKKTAKAAQTASYEHNDAKALLRPEAGAQSRFKKSKPKRTYRYDSSLAPELAWDGQNPVREQGEAKLAAIEQGLRELATQHVGWADEGSPSFVPHPIQGLLRGAGYALVMSCVTELSIGSTDRR